MFRRFRRHIKEGFLGVGRHFGMAMSSASAVTITLILIGLFLLLTSNLALLSKDIEDSISLVALISYDVDGSSKNSKVSSIEAEIKKIEGVASVEYRTKDQEFDFYNETYPDMKEFSDLYRDSNPFHDTFIVKLATGSQMENVKSSIERINGIDEVEDGGDNTYILVDILQKTRIFGGALVIALCILAVYLIYNTIRITIASRTDEIWIMRNVGAKNSYIRAPFLVEGILIGLCGSILPVILIIAAYLYIFRVSNGTLMNVFALIPPKPFLIYLCGGLTLLGIIVGFLGSFISVTRFLRFRR